MNRKGRRLRPGYKPGCEKVEERFLLSRPDPTLRAIMAQRPAAHLVRPNTPVAPFGAPANGSYIDPSVRIVHGQHAVIGLQSFVGPYATLDASGAGFIKIGSASAVLDNAALVANPGNAPESSAIIVGDKVTIGFGAAVFGPSQIGGFGDSALPTRIGSNAVIDGATIQPGAIVGALAKVGPGVTVPTGFRVLPGSLVTTNAEASNPALGKVVPVTAADLNTLNQDISDNIALASGYISLYQGNRATGISPGVDPSITTVFNGNLAAVEGTSQEPGTALVKFEPAAQGPQFPSRRHGLVEGLLPQFRARVVGQTIFGSRAGLVAHHFGRSDSVRADEGQPIKFASAPNVGNAVTINVPLTGQLVIGRNLTINDGAVLLGGPLAKATDRVTIGDNVTIGPGAVVDRTSIGDGAVIGARAYVANSTIPAGASVPAGAIIVNNKRVGTVQ